MNDPKFPDTKFFLGPEFPGYSVVFIQGFTDFDEWDMPQRGYRSGVCLEDEIKGTNYPLYFYDIDRLTYDLDMAHEHAIKNGDGAGYIAEYGLVIIQEVTLANILMTVKLLLRNGYFKNQKGYPIQEIKKKFAIEE